MGLVHVPVPSAEEFASMKGYYHEQWYPLEQRDGLPAEVCVCASVRAMRSGSTVHALAGSVG